MAREVLAIDVDEVQFPFVPAFADFHNRVYGTNFQPEDFSSYRFEEVLLVSPDEVGRRIHAFHEQDDLHIEPLAGAAAAIGRLANEYELVVLTARESQFEQRTISWIQARIGDHFSDYRHIGFSGNKAEECRKLGARSLIDDTPRHIFGCVQLGMEGALFGDYGWNRTEVLRPGAVRTVDWDKVLEHFDA